MSADMVVTVDQMPVLLGTNALLAWAESLDRYVTLDELETALLRIGRVNGPYFLFSLYASGSVLGSEIRACVGSVWSCAEYPDQELERDEWRELFEVAGFTIDGMSAARPTEPLTLWRGSVPERRDDWSWTDDPGVAEKYAAGYYHRAPGKVWQASVAPWRLLARNTGRRESEYVIDTDGLVIQEAGAVS